MTTETDTMPTLHDQATEGLYILMDGGLVRVCDGQDTWICTVPVWDAAMAIMDVRPAYSDSDDPAENGAMAYGRLCEETARAARAQHSAILTVIGTPTGSARAQRELARRAIGLEMWEEA